MRVLLALCLLFAVPVWADTLPGVVIVVIDGDTLLFKPDAYHPSSRAFLKVRLAEVDAPEANQPHGEAATRALKNMALKRRATLEVVAIDRYGRKLGLLSVGALQVNAELVRRGDAWASSRDAADPLRTVQDEARRAQRGLWAEAAPTPPWVWRRAQPVAN